MKPSIGSSVEHDSVDQRWMVGVCVVSAFLFCYAQVFVGMVQQWWNISFYSYAFLIPVVSVYLVWIRRDQVLAIMPRPHYASGVALLASGLLALVIGQVGGIKSLQQISLLITIPGMILFLFGKAVLKAVWLPIAFLLFMLPIWEVVTDPLHLRLQAFSANVGVMFLRAVGIPVFQDGVYIYLPNITLEVARECSGVNYLIAVLATSIPLATIVLIDVRKRIVLVLLAMIVSVFANSLRVALIGALAYYNLSGDLHGPYHTLHGIFVSLIGYVVIFLGLWILSRGQVRDNPRPSVPARSGKIWVSEGGQSTLAWGGLTAVFLLVGASQYVDRSQPVPLRQSLSEFPVEIAGWIGSDAAPVDAYPGTDQQLSRIYRRDSGGEVRLLLSYFESQQQGKELVNSITAKLHSDAMRSKVDLGQRGEAEMNWLLRDDGERKRMILFWYDLDGRIVAGQYVAKLNTAFGAVLHGRTNGAMVWLAADLISDDQSEKSRTLAMLTEFASSLYPSLDRFLPHSAD